MCERSVCGEYCAEEETIQFRVEFTDRHRNNNKDVTDEQTVVLTI